MKKLLTLLGAIGLTATTTTSVVACGNSKQLQPIDTTEFEKLTITEAQGKYFTIEQAVEGINKINNLPEGIESINVSILESPTIQVEFIAQKGYETPKPFTVNFKAKQQTGKSKINLYEI
ncbi:lipoprotein, partial [Mesoplasma seiffertii]|uniref:lipoprotein n=1 Tax=Mesoplasma seiffertii TaxID=28224 RepID=UPI00056CBE24